MKFELIKKVDGEVSVYEGKTAKTGDILEFSNVFAKKAEKNPDYLRVDAAVAESLEDANKPRRGRKPKVTDGDEG